MRDELREARAIIVITAGIHKPAEHLLRVMAVLPVAIERIEIAAALRDGPSCLESAQVEKVMDLLLLGRGRIKKPERFGGGVGGFQIDEELAKLPVQRPACGRIMGVEPLHNLRRELG